MVYLGWALVAAGGATMAVKVLTDLGVISMISG